MRIYVFSSTNLTNIWAGVGAQLWAVSPQLADNQGTITKSQKLKVGSLGLLYCSDTQEFTTPFLVKSMPLQVISVKDVWPETWELPFEIAPLGSPQKRLSKDAVDKEMPSVVESGKRWNKILFVQANFSFQPSNISAEDWAYLFGKLGK